MNIFRSYAFEGFRAGSIMASGDLIAQTYVEGKSLKDVDMARTARFGIIGMCFLGPTLKFWYGTLERRIAKGPALQRGAKKMLLDQIVMPAPLTVTITGLLCALEGGSPKQVKDRICRDFLPVFKTNYMVWPAAQIVTFTVIPLRYQVLFVQIVALFWNAFVSVKLNKF